MVCVFVSEGVYVLLAACVLDVFVWWLVGCLVGLLADSFSFIGPVLVTVPVFGYVVLE
jgi:hypothetical protein